MSQSRRSFLKSSLIASTALLTPTTLLNIVARGQQSITGDKVRLGVIGTGSRGIFLMNLISSIAEDIGVEFVAICDVYAPNLEIAQKQYPNSKPYTDYRRLLERKDVDGVIVATPLHQHAHITIDALESGKHVFCEKAMARTLDDTLAMVQAHKHTGKILHIGHQRLFDPKYLRGMEMIFNGDLGKVTQIRAYWHRNNDWRRPVPAEQPELERFINWRLYRDYSCGLMTELASHQIQVANWAKKDIPLEVRGAGSISYWKDGREVEDNVALIFSYQDGTQFIYDSMIQNRKYGLEEQIMGDKGTIELETNRFFLEEPPEPPKPAGILQLISDIEKNLFGTVPIGSSSWDPEVAVPYPGEALINDDTTDGTLEQMVAFANSLREGKAIDGLLEQCYYGSVWTLLGQEAIDTGKAVRMDGKYII